jgi:hypothetical protein
MLVVAALAVNLFLSTFGGTWLCTTHGGGAANAAPARWTIAAVPHSAWAVVRWGEPGAGGTAYVGYLAPLGAWMYDDFHSDGSFTASTSNGPQNGVWTWSATYTTPRRIEHGTFQWRRDERGIRQGFGRALGTTFLEASYAVCTPAGP